MPLAVRRLTAAALSLLLLGALASCAFAPQPVVTRLPTDAATGRAVPTTPTPSATSAATIPPPQAPDGAADRGDGTDCAGLPVTLTADTSSLVLRGDCPSVQVQGNDMAVDLADASVGEIQVSGERTAVALGEAASVSVQGNDVVVDAASITTLVMRGDRNTVSSSSDVDAVQVSGNDNTVSAGSIRSVVVEGSGNSVG